MQYNTKNKIKILNCLKENSYRHLTIDQIVELLDNQIPLASVYRIIDSLVLEGLVRKYVIDNNTSACFQYIENSEEHNHFHMLCTKCGKLIHLECDEVNHLLKHIENDHDFKIDITKVTLYGVCADCQKENK